MWIYQFENTYMPNEYVDCGVYIQVDVIRFVFGSASILLWDDFSPRNVYWTLQLICYFCMLCEHSMKFFFYSIFKIFWCCRHFWCWWSSKSSQSNNQNDSPEMWRDWRRNTTTIDKRDRDKKKTKITLRPIQCFQLERMKSQIPNIGKDNNNYKM